MLKSVLRTLFLPTLSVNQLSEIPLQYLQDTGHKVFFLDADNTLLKRDDRLVPLDILHWVHTVKGMGFHVVVLSNNSKKLRIQRICEQLDVQGYYRAMKPFPHTLYNWCREHKIPPHNTVVVGDQLLTDILLGQWVRAYTVLVEPLDKKFSIIKSIQREIELKIVHFLAKKPL